jgi:DNA-dependent RNA polymerase auxiliary subunit epsilon
MKRDLTTSVVERQNILNNTYALKEAEKAIGMRGVVFENELKFTKQQTAQFLGVSTRAISNCIQNNEEELKENGYEEISGNRLKIFKLLSRETFGGEVNFPTKTTRLTILNFRTFLNISMLLTKSERAKQVRSLVLDIVIDTINKRTGGNTKYINQRDEDFVRNLLTSREYHKEFVSALTDYVDLGKIKYITYTDKVYRSIFKENADEYRRILNLERDENERNTMYSEVLDLISSFEVGFADLLKTEYIKVGHKLSAAETDKIYDTFSNQRCWEPLVEKARTKMASRDLCFRDALHTSLSKYVSSVTPEDFDRFIGNKSMPIEERLKEIMVRLKERES